MRFFSEAEVRRLLDPAEVMAGIREAFSRDYRSTVTMPVRTRLELGSSILLLMPCHDTALKAAGVKMVTVGSSGVNATYVLLDPASGEMLATIEAGWLTELRTAAVSALATDVMARPEAHTLGIFGSGRQAVAHLAVVSRVRSFRRFLVCGSGRSDLSEFCSRIKQEYQAEITPVDAESCVRESDVICTCTTSSQPLFSAAWLKPGTHLNLVGAFQPHTREVDSETVARSRVVVDTYEGALAEAGEIVVPMREGVIDRAHIIADLHELLSGKKAVRTSPEDITLFKSLGCALEDLVAAMQIMRNGSL